MTNPQHNRSPKYNFRILSCWSKAGLGTSIVIEYKAQQGAGARIVLDLGATPCYIDSLRASVVLLSHGHVDHVGAIFSHARAYSLSNSGTVPTYYAPKPLVPLLVRAADALAALDAANDGSGSRTDSLLKLKFVGVEAGDDCVLPIKKGIDGKQLFIRVFKTFHEGCPSVGYVVGSRSSPTLKQEYQGLPGTEIAALKKSGVQVTETTEVLELAYTGDTSFETFEPRNDAPFLQQALSCHFFLTEATMLEQTDKFRNLAREKGHMHIDDVVALLESRQWKQHQQIVLLHISARYTAQQALDAFHDSISSNLAKHCSIAVSALNGAGAHELGFSLQGNRLVRLQNYANHLSGGGSHRPRRHETKIDNRKNSNDQDRKPPGTHHHHRRKKPRAEHDNDRDDHGDRKKAGRGHHHGSKRL